MRRIVPPSLLVLATVIAAPPALRAADLPAGFEQAEQVVTTGGLLRPIRFLSSDLLGGRGPGSTGDELARAYLASRLEGMGLEPGAPDGSYQQRFPMVGLKAESPRSWTFSANDKSERLAWWDDFIAASGVQQPSAAIDGAELVFVGYGIQAPEYQWDDFKGADLKGKVLLMLNNDPDWDPQLFAGKTRLYYGRWTYKYESAARQGAVGAIIIHTTPSAGYPWQVVQTSWSGEQFELPAEGEPRIAVKAWTTEAATRRMLALAGQDLEQLVQAAHSRDFRPVPLGIRTSFTMPVAVRRIETANVAGLLRGSDPQLAHQVVIYSAHHDHLGTGAPDKNGDRIYNGAIDNGTGCAQLLEIAKAFTALPDRPRRSVLFLFVAAEEQGLLGSAYYARHPTFPPGEIAADINVDAGNVFGRTSDITYIGYGKSSLDQVIDAAAARQHRTVVGDTMPDRGFFYRSDQFSFAKIGVPGLYIDGGKSFVGKDPEYGKKLQETYESTCYHQPCDEIHSDWDLTGLVEDTQLAFDCGLQLADAETMPSWKPGDEFEAARKEALAKATK